MQNEEKTYKKTRSCGAEGLDFQLNMILHVLLQVIKLELVSFKLYSELKTAGNFEDIVLIYEDKNKNERSCLLQAKHSTDTSKTVSLQNLISDKYFKLSKYFDSFKEINKEEQFRDSLEHLILCTNLNLSESLLPYVEEFQPQLLIWNCQTVKGINKKPQLYKLNSQFIDEYQYFELCASSKVIVDYCIKGNELKLTHNNIKNCHLLLAREVFNVEEKCFREEFIEGTTLSPETKIFRDILFKQIKEKKNKGKSGINDDTLMWLRKQKLKFVEEFGQSSSKAKQCESWPNLLKDEDKQLFTKFCSYLILALNQPNDGELEECLTRDCAEHFSPSMVDMAKGELKFKIRQWYKMKVSPPLDCKFFYDAVDYIKNNEQEVNTAYVSRCEIEELFAQTNKILGNSRKTPYKIEKFLEKSETLFDTLSLMKDIEMFMKTNGKMLLQIITQNSDLSSIKTILCLSELNHEYLFTSKSKIKELREVFRVSTCYNVFVWRILSNSTSDFDDLLDDIRDKNKKVIVITNEGQNVSTPQLEAAEDWIQRINDETQFGHLTEITRNKFLKRNVSFQGCDMEINKILLNNFPLEQVANDSWGELISSEDIHIGQKVNLSQEYNSNYYIQRTIVLTNTNTGTEQSLNEKEFMQHALHRSFEGGTDITSNYEGCEMFILSDPAGMGKTAVTSSLADEIKFCYPHYWVTRLVAMECAFDLNHFDGNTSDAAYDDLFMSKLLKLSSPLERFVFGQYLKNENSVNKLVIIFDGYDEINEKCQRVIVSLLQYLRRKPNVGFIVITTRPQFQQDLEEHFQRKASILRPFDENNKIEFLQKYWTSRGIKGNNLRLTEYAEQLIKCISCSITEEESQLTGIPLQMRMIAEIYEQEARSNVLNKEEDLDSSTMSLGLFDLYEKFMKIKVDICLKDKLDDKGLTSNTKQITSALHHQSKFAREIILERLDVPKVEVPDLELTTQLGIIQKNPEGGFYFIHRTFAEFLTAKYLLEEIIERESVPVADKIKNGLLIEEIKKSSLYVVRQFINSRLNSAKLAENCKRSNDKEAMQRLLGDNCTDIIVTSAEEEIHEFLKLTIEVNSWLTPDLMYSKLKDSLWEVRNNSKYLTAILQCMLDKWLPTKDDILMKTIEFLIREILVMVDENEFNRREFIKSAIDFQNKLERDMVLTENRLGIILHKVRYDVVNLSKCYRWNAIEYLKYIHSKHRDLFYVFFKDNRTFLHTLMKNCYNSYLRDFLSLIQSDKEKNTNWVFINLIEDHFFEFGGWEDEHFKLYFSILHSCASERKEKFRSYLEEVIRLIYRQYDLSFKGLFAKFLMDYETLISLDEILSKFDKTKTTADLEYCAFWGQTNKLKEILEVGDIEAAAAERFQLAGGTHDLAAIRRKILISIRERQGEEEEFLQWIGQRNWNNETILQHAIRNKDSHIKELISTWITTEEIFDKIMMIDQTRKTKSVLESYLDFVNDDDRLSKFRMRFLEINKNSYILKKKTRKQIFRIIEKDENFSQVDFVQILKLQANVPDYEGYTILHRILEKDDIDILRKCLELMKKLDPRTIEHLFHIRNKNGKSPLDQSDSNYVRRQKKRKICNDFFDKRDLKKLSILDLEYY